jgi:hypothetical protein
MFTRQWQPKHRHPDGDVMRRISLAFALAIALATIAPAAARDAHKGDTCPYLPQFKELEKKLQGMAPAAALGALARYEADPNNENPAACEGFALDRLMSKREMKLVFLARGKTRLHAQWASHCDTVTEATLKCDGVFADDTAHPRFAGIRPRRLERTVTLRVRSALPDARLDGVYLAPIADLLDGKAATRIDAAADEITLVPPTSPTAVIAIFHAPAPWRYRKLVWYFE